MSTPDTGDLDAPLGCLSAPALAGLAAQLGAVTGLAESEQLALHRAAAARLRDTLRRKLVRVLVLELNAARLAGALTGPDPAARWAEFIAHASTPEFWSSRSGRYPTMLDRIHRVIDAQCAAAVALAERFTADRDALAVLLDTAPGELLEVRLGSGDSHRGGYTVATLRCAGGTVMYKPHPVTVDAALARLLAGILPDEPPATRIRVPDVLPRDGYGWTAHVAHRYCADASELRAFYRGIGHWLAVMRLLGGSDLHAENLIACGPVPVVVDCETLFTPHLPAPPTGRGVAADTAAAMVAASVLRTGLLPGRGLALGWRGVDASGAGALPGEQPVGEIPVLLDAGTDQARIGLGPAQLPPTANHPTAEPVLDRYWEHVLTGFDELHGRLVTLGAGGRLEPLLAGFAGTPVRVVLRATEVYAELGRMLWHPASLHDEPAAVRRAGQLLELQGEHRPGIPDDPAVIAAEIADLLGDDVPYFSTTPASGRLAGPGGTWWGEPIDLVADAVARWRTGNLRLDRQVIQAALVSAYLNEGGGAADSHRMTVRPTGTGLDRRRRDVAAALVARLAGAATRGDDGTVTWIAPVLSQTGWAVQPLGPDLYGGLAGMAVLLAAYQREAAAGRATPVPAVADLLAGTLRTMRAEEDYSARQRRDTAAPQRPDPPGGYVGLGSRITGWLLLDRLGAGGGDAVDRAVALAAEVPAAIEADGQCDLLVGTAGVIVPLLELADRTGDKRWVQVAAAAGDRLASAAQVTNGRARWLTAGSPRGLGGFAHGATGMGWALYRLAEATVRGDLDRLARAAFDFEESLWVPAEGGWRDLRNADFVAAAWCHGSGGIGLVAADLLSRAGAADADAERYRDRLRRAVAHCWRVGTGWTHTLCHGDFGNAELVEAAIAAGVGPPGLDRDELHAHLISGVEQHGAVSGLARDVFAPGLLAGTGGMVYQLLRMHPDAELPSVLLPGLEQGRLEQARLEQDRREQTGRNRAGSGRAAGRYRRG